MKQSDENYVRLKSRAWVRPAAEEKNEEIFQTSRERWLFQETSSLLSFSFSLFTRKRLWKTNSKCCCCCCNWGEQRNGKRTLEILNMERKQSTAKNQEQLERVLQLHRESWSGCDCYTSNPKILLCLFYISVWQCDFWALCLLMHFIEISHYFFLIDSLFYSGDTCIICQILSFFCSFFSVLDKYVIDSGKNFLWCMNLYNAADVKCLVGCRLYMTVNRSFN